LTASAVSTSRSCRRPPKVSSPSRRRRMMTRCRCTCTHAHMHICTHAHMHICTHAHMHTCTYAHMHICTHAHMHICSHAHMLTCTYAHMHICTHAHGSLLRIAAPLFGDSPASRAAASTSAIDDTVGSGRPLPSPISFRCSLSSPSCRKDARPKPHVCMHTPRVHVHPTCACTSAARLKPRIACSLLLPLKHVVPEHTLGCGHHSQPIRGIS
jgi:hypothetical protein